MNKPLQNRIDPGYYTMLFLVMLGLLVMLGTFVLGPLMSVLK
ncbi:hypothetical protein [Flavilitoribacter nigricans]|nr:hypothetical protein [Flavilitoribacter nigricans]